MWKNSKLAFNTDQVRLLRFQAERLFRYERAKKMDAPKDIMIHTEILLNKGWRDFKAKELTAIDLEMYMLCREIHQESMRKVEDDFDDCE